MGQLQTHKSKGQKVIKDNDQMEKVGSLNKTKWKLIKISLS